MQKDLLQGLITNNLNNHVSLTHQSNKKHPNRVPLFRGPRIFSSGTSQSSKTSSQVLDPLIPSLSNFCAVENPFIP